MLLIEDETKEAKEARTTRKKRARERAQVACDSKTHTRGKLDEDVKKANNEWGKFTWTYIDECDNMELMRKFLKVRPILYSQILFDHLRIVAHRLFVAIRFRLSALAP